MYVLIVTVTAVGFALAALLILIRKGLNSKASFSNIEGRRCLLMLCLAGMLIIPVSAGIPVLLGKAVVYRCNALNRETGNEIIQALETYKQNNEDYPQTLNALVPEYLAAVPNSQCDPFNDMLFELVECPSGHNLLVVPTTDGYRYQRYSLESSEWLEPIYSDRMFKRIAACLDV